MNEQFTVGKVLSTGSNVWAKNVVPFFFITALVYLPLIIPLVVLVQGPMTNHRIQQINDIYAYMPGAISLLGTLVGAALTYGVVMELQGQRASFGACVTTGLKRFLPSLAVALLVMLCIALGFLCLIIPGIIVACTLNVATQASIMEKPGIIGALKRSRTLTAGHGGSIFGLMVVQAVFAFAAQMLVHNVLQRSLTIQALIYVDLLRTVLTGSLMAVMAAVTYFYLRQEKEGTSAAELGQVFA